MAIPALNFLGAGLGAVLLGNMTMPMAAAIVFAMRPRPAWSPAWYAIPILTKLTAGSRACSGSCFVASGDRSRSALGSRRPWWRSHSLLRPQRGSSGSNSTLRTTTVRPAPPSSAAFPCESSPGVLIVAWGARTNRPWVTPIAGGIALPALYGLSSGLSVALAAYAIWRQRRLSSTWLRAIGLPSPIPAA